MSVRGTEAQQNSKNFGGSLFFFRRNSPQLLGVPGIVVGGSASWRKVGGSKTIAYPANAKAGADGLTPFDELNGQFSPDGRWVAYETNESGRFEIVLQPFPSPTAKWQVSTADGVQPRWRADGKELYFYALDGKVMASSVTTTGATFVAAAPVALFSVALAPGAGTNKQEYMVSRDGRFLINQPMEASTTTPITVILNWKPKP